MTENFDSYNAPQFFDFSKDLHVEENTDAYFEVDHENVKLEDIPNNKNSETIQENDDFREFYYTPKTTPGNGNNNDMTIDRKNVRRSMSVGDLNLLQDSEPDSDHEDVKNIRKVASNTTESPKQATTSRSTHSLRKPSSNMSINSETGSTKSRLTKYSSREKLDRLAQPKRHHSSAQNLNQNSYVPMAEAVKMFQNGTPRRFRSKPNLKSNEFNKPTNTIPQSPFLITKGRHRQLNILSREQQEILEYEECQKFKIKAQPLNKKILGPMKSIAIEKKAATIPEPFNITAAPRRVMDSPKKEVFEFHARPIPKYLHDPPKLKEIKRISTTTPHTPTFMKQYVKEPIKVQEKQEETKTFFKTKKTKPIPFSFERRDQIIQKNKEEMIKKVLEDEKKAREFHARPIPKAILNVAKNSSLQRINSSNNIRVNGLTKSEESLSTQFKARPATVLYKKPFEPKKDERHLIEITEFQLNTEMRAKEREEFEQIKREKEEKIILAKQMEEEMRMRNEEEEIAKIRKESEYKAQPIKKYKELKIQPSGKVTEPISPKFHTNKSRNKENKENSCDN